MSEAKDWTQNLVWFLVGFVSTAPQWEFFIIINTIPIFQGYLYTNTLQNIILDKKQSQMYRNCPPRLRLLFSDPLSKGLKLSYMVIRVIHFLNFWLLPKSSSGSVIYPFSTLCSGRLTFESTFYLHLCLANERHHLQLWGWGVRSVFSCPTSWCWLFSGGNYSDKLVCNFIFWVHRHTKCLIFLLSNKMRVIAN